MSKHFGRSNFPNWPALGAEIARNRFGTYVAARQWYATPALFEADADALKLLLQSRTAGRHSRANHVVNPDKWLFLDTEATGFIGGEYALQLGLPSAIAEDASRTLHDSSSANFEWFRPPRTK